MAPCTNDIKRAVVLGGGGSRGAYQVGCWRAMEESGMEYHVVTGTSVGALNGGMMVQRRLEDAWRIWSELDVSQVLADMPTPESLSDYVKTFQSFAMSFIRDGGADTEPLEKLAKSVMDEERLRSSGIDYGIVTLDLKTRKPRELLLGEMPRGSVADYMLASATCFPAFRPKELDGSLYIDGGFYDNLPINLALRSHVRFDEIWAIDVEGPGLVKKADTRLPVHTIKSYWELGNFLIFDNAMINRDLALGYNDMRKTLGMLDGLSYTFQKGESAFLEVCYANRLLAVIEEQKSLKLLSDTMQSFAEDRLMKVLQDRSGDTIHRGDAALAAAEWAGEALRLDPVPLYTMESFNAALLEAYNELKAASGSLSLDKYSGISKLQLIAELKERAAEAPILLVSELLRRVSALELPIVTEAVAMALPKTYLSCLYLDLIRNNQTA